MNIALVGYGAMGQLIDKLLTEKVVGIVSEGYLDSLYDINEKIDCIIDFSHPSNLDMICQYASKNKTKVVIATTGYSDLQIEKIKKLSLETAVLYSANFSLGVIVMNRLVKQITPLLKDKFDIEMIEKHHNKKIDSPSGTAKLLLNSINSDNDFTATHGREGVSKRMKKEIGVHSIRGGSIIGEHEVIYAGLDEVLSIKHEAHSKAIFANGAISGAKWLMAKKTGLYDMEDVLFEV